MTPSQEKLEIAKHDTWWNAEDRSLDGNIRLISEASWLARASECHSLTKEEAGRVIFPYTFDIVTGDADEGELEVMNTYDVIALLMEHSNPSPVLEEVKKKMQTYIDKFAPDRRFNTSEQEIILREYERLLTFITELSKGKV